jgi:hypothetical protein
MGLEAGDSQINIAQQYNQGNLQILEVQTQGQIQRAPKVRETVSLLQGAKNLEFTLHLKFLKFMEVGSVKEQVMREVQQKNSWKT